MILLTLPRSGSHLLATIMKCGALPTMKANGTFVPEDVVVGNINKNESFWFHYPYNEAVRYALACSQQDKYLLLRDPRDIIVSWAHYCEEVDSPLDIIVLDRYLHTYPVKNRIDFLIKYVKDLMFDYEKWRQSGMFTVLRYGDILFNPLATTQFVGFRSGRKGDYKIEMTAEQIKESTKIYKELITLW